MAAGGWSPLGGSHQKPLSSQRGRPTLCYLLHFATRQNAGRAREVIKKQEWLQRCAGQGCQKCSKLLQSRHECIIGIHLNFKYRAL